MKAFRDIGLENTISSLIASGLLPREYLTKEITMEDREEWTNLIDVVLGDPRAIVNHLVDNMLSKCIEECDVDCSRFNEIISRYFLLELPQDLRAIVIMNIDKDMWSVIERVCKGV